MSDFHWTVDLDPDCDWEDEESHCFAGFEEAERFAREHIRDDGINQIVILWDTTPAVRIVMDALGRIWTDIGVFPYTLPPIARWEILAAASAPVAT